MDYEILVLKSTGEISDIHPVGHVWGTNERDSSIFDLVPYTGEPKEVTELSTRKYRYVGGVFVNQETGQKFDPAIVVDLSDAPPETITGTLVLAREMDSGVDSRVTNLCEFLTADYLKQLAMQRDFDSIRKYWYNKFVMFKDQFNVKPLLAAVLYSNYGDIRKVCDKIADKDKDAMLSSKYFSDEDRAYLRTFWGMR